MADIPHKTVVRRLVNIMQRHGQLHRTEIAGEMAAGFPYRFKQKRTQLLRQLRQLFFIQAAQILRQVDGIE